MSELHRDTSDTASHGTTHRWPLRIVLETKQKLHSYELSQQSISPSLQAHSRAPGQFWNSTSDCFAWSAVDQCAWVWSHTLALLRGRSSHKPEIYVIWRAARRAHRTVFYLISETTYVTAYVVPLDRTADLNADFREFPEPYAARRTILSVPLAADPLRLLNTLRATSRRGYRGTLICVGNV